MKTRCVLAVLLHARGEPVSMEALIDRVWGDGPPVTAVDTMQSYVSRLRGLLRKAVGDLVQVDRPSPRRYQLWLDPRVEVDLSHFRRLRKEARAAAGQGRQELAVGLLRAAEDRWRGDPLPESTSDWADSVRGRLVEDHRSVRGERIRLELELGRHADLIGELHELAAESPLAQQVIASLMLALYRSGRPDEALQVYRNTRQRLRDGLGIEPGPDLQELHQSILKQDRTLTRTATVVELSAAREPRSNLPRDSRDFTGRTEELRLLLGDAEHLAADAGTRADAGRAAAGPRPHDATRYAMPLTVIHGMPGIGKTALAVHAAHRLRAAYPGGLLYVDLHGYSGRPPYEPAEALAVLLHAAGVDSGLPDPVDGEPPDPVDVWAARWREWTSRHRVLVVLDNARSSSQVRPLLPGSAACRAIVTSRKRLAGLDGATALRMEVLPGPEAAALFTRIAGADRVPADPGALTAVTDACGCHPLMIQLLASRFRHRKSWDLGHLLDRLAAAADPLDEFDDGELVSVMRFSYTELAPPTRSLLVRLALHPGPDITVAAATALAGTAPDGALVRRSVDELQDFHLLEEPSPGRYRLHELTRAFALRELTRTEPPEARTEALDRLFAHYLTTAHHADRHTRPLRRRLPSATEHVSAYAQDFACADDAAEWLVLERANLLAVAVAAAGEASRYAAFFPHVIAPELKQWGTWAVTNKLYGAAVPALRARGDRYALAQTLVEAAEALAQTGHDEALSCANEALVLFRQLDRPDGCADALLQAGRAHLAAGRGKAALKVLDDALTECRRIGMREREADVLNVQGAALFQAGRYGEALDKVRVMLGIHQETGNFLGQIHALNNSGDVCASQGRYPEALEFYERSLELARLHGGRQELDILDTNMGAVYQATGQTAQALACFQRSLESHRAHGDALGEINVLIQLGKTHAELGRRDEGLAHLLTAVEVARRIDSPYECQRALLGAADVQYASGQFAAAARGYEEALAVARAAASLLGCARAVAGLARTALRTGNLGLAKRRTRLGAALYSRLAMREEADELRNLLRDHPRVADS
ncbi:BTAD domain-containing putative transcriptional regulator [Streptomyces sp. NPDC014685]|uniref:AfsR/SARP family transcriptional regulator n=1 Tax=Streptomyces sp. NPDC014685 TaxID=3364881 RepID=UPI0036F8428D